MKTRDLLERSGKAVPAATGSKSRQPVEISHHEARVLRSEMHGTLIIDAYRLTDAQSLAETRDLSAPRGPASPRPGATARR